MTGRIFGGRLAAAAAVAAHLIYMGAAGPASAMQILEAADHGELAAEISATGVNRIALSHDRVRRVIRSPGGFETEHDPETGDLWLRPTVAGQGAAAPEGSGGESVVLFIGTEKGFTYRLTLTPTGRDSAQLLIRNGAARARAEAGAAAQTAGTDPRLAALVGLIRAVARREPAAGYAIETGTGKAIGGLPVIETWRGTGAFPRPRFAAHVVEGDNAVVNAADLAGTMGLRAAAAWLAGPGSGPSGGRLAVIVTDAAGPADTIPADVFLGGPQ